MRPCIEYRRNRGWAKLADISAIFSDMPDIRRLEVGLQLRDTKLHNGILYNSEAWSNIRDKDVERIEQVDVVGPVGAGGGALQVPPGLLVSRIWHFNAPAQNNDPEAPLSPPHPDSR